MTRLSVLACAFTCCPPGAPGFKGGEDVLGWNLLEQLARFHDVWALSHPDNRGGVEYALEQRPVPNLHFRFVGLPNAFRPLLRIQGGHQLYYYLWQFKAYLAARALHQELHFDLFHHITYANDWMVSFIGALLPIPYIRGPGGGAHRTPKGLEGEYSLSGQIWEKFRAIGQWLFRHDPLFIKGQSRAKAILVCNRESVRNIPNKWSHKVQVFPVNGITNKDLSLSTVEPIRDGPFRVLSAGSLIRVKGFSLAIKAFKEFVDKYPRSEFKIIGSGPEESRLRAIIDRSQLASKVELIHAMPRDELLPEMASCDVFLFPSLRDGGGAVAIEAMAVGKPVVCLDTGGPGMHVTEECGIKITPNSPGETVSALAEALERLYLDDDLRLKLGNEGSERAKQLYHWDRLGQRLFDIYQQAASVEGSH